MGITFNTPIDFLNDGVQIILYLSIMGVPTYSEIHNSSEKLIIPFEVLLSSILVVADDNIVLSAIGALHQRRTLGGSPSGCVRIPPR